MFESFPQDSKEETENKTFSQAEQYVREVSEKIDEDYPYNCTRIADNIAKKILAEGGEPRLLKVESQDKSYENQMLKPKRYDGEVSWGDHTVCEANGIIYDPIRRKPVEKDEYLSDTFTTQAEAKEWVSTEKLRENMKDG